MEKERHLILRVSNQKNTNSTNSRQIKRKLHGTIFLNMDQLQKQLDNNEFQEIGSTSSFKVLETQSGNDAHVDDADIRPIYNEEPMAEVQTSAEINIFATGQQHTESNHEFKYHAFNPIQEGLRYMVAEKTDISENRASRNFDFVMIGQMANAENKQFICPVPQFSKDV
ncbi:hypothetical protein Tco_1411026 [Tanacetum coccineum]